MMGSKAWYRDIVMTPKALAEVGLCEVCGGMETVMAQAVSQPQGVPVLIPCPACMTSLPKFKKGIHK